MMVMSLMHADEDCSWEEVYRSCGVRCDIEEDSSSLGRGVCPTPRANPLYISNKSLERWMGADRIPEDAIA